MGVQENRAKNAKMAKDMKDRGIWHGRRMTVGQSNIPPNETGSAAYRRLREKQKRGA